MAQEQGDAPLDSVSALVDAQIKAVFHKLRGLDPHSAGFLSNVLTLQEEVLLIGSAYTLSPNQQKALQLEMSCIEDYISLGSIYKEVEHSVSPSKEQMLQMNYLIADVDHSIQGLQSIC